MTLVETFPDSEAIAGYAVRAANITGLGTRVYSSVPNTPTYPLATLQRFGGVPADRHRLDRARIQITVWGTSKSEARRIAAGCRTALFGMEGKSYTVAGGAPADAFVSGVEDDMGLTWSPDPETDRDRYLFGVAVFLHR